MRSPCAFLVVIAACGSPSAADVDSLAPIVPVTCGVECGVFEQSAGGLEQAVPGFNPEIVYALPMRTGDRIRGVTFARSGDSFIDITYSLRLTVRNGSQVTLGLPGAEVDVPFGFVDRTITLLAPFVAIGSGDIVELVVVASGSPNPVQTNSVRYVFERAPSSAR